MELAGRHFATSKVAADSERDWLQLMNELEPVLAKLCENCAEIKKYIVAKKTPFNLLTDPDERTRKAVLNIALGKEILEEEPGDIIHLFNDFTENYSDTNKLLDKGPDELVLTPLASAADFIELAKISLEVAQILVSRYNKSLSSLFVECADFIELAKISCSILAADLVMGNREMISSLFTASSDFIKLAKIWRAGPDILTDHNSESLSSLFLVYSDFFELLKASEPVAWSLTQRQKSILILALRVNRSQFMELVEKSRRVAKILVKENSLWIAGFFAKSEKDFNELSTIDKTVAEELQLKQRFYLKLSWRAFEYWPSLALFSFGALYDDGISFSLPKELITKITSMLILRCKKENFDRAVERYAIKLL